MVGALKIGAVVALAAALWVVPSVGTLGQGTLGDRFIHPDRNLVPVDGRATLVRADQEVARAVAGL